jgi:hypothetical protein
MWGEEGVGGMYTKQEMEVRIIDSRGIGFFLTKSSTSSKRIRWAQDFRLVANS